MLGNAAVRAATGLALVFEGCKHAVEFALTVLAELLIEKVLVDARSHRAELALLITFLRLLERPRDIGLEPGTKLLFFLLSSDDSDLGLVRGPPERLIHLIIVHVWHDNE
jgi:hypothetical protein